MFAMAAPLYQVRRELMGASSPVYSGYTCYTGISDFTPPDLEIVGYRVFLGNGQVNYDSMEESGLDGVCTLKQHLTRSAHACARLCHPAAASSILHKVDVCSLGSYMLLLVLMFAVLCQQ